MKSSYTKRRLPDGWHFDVQPAPPRYPVVQTVTAAIILGGLAFLVAAFAKMATQSTGISVLTGVGLGVPIVWHLRRQIRNTVLKLRYPCSFDVTSMGVEAGATRLARGDVHRFVLKNWRAKTHRDISMTVVVGAPGLDTAFRSGNAAIANAAARAGAEYERRLAETCWQLDIEAGGQAFMLACGMDETTANGLMHDVSRALDA